MKEKKVPGAGLGALGAVLPLHISPNDLSEFPSVSFRQSAQPPLCRRFSSVHLKQFSYSVY